MHRGTYRWDVERWYDRYSGDIGLLDTNIHDEGFFGWFRHNEYESTVSLTLTTGSIPNGRDYV